MVNENDRNQCKIPNHNAVGRESLTELEKDIIQLIGRGLTNKQIAKGLFTTETFIARSENLILQKLQVKDRLNLVIYAYQNELLKTS